MLVRLSGSFPVWGDSVQRIARPQARESREIAIGTPQLAHVVLQHMGVDQDIGINRDPGFSS
jgi:hypothetical protein